MTPETPPVAGDESELGYPADFDVAGFAEVFGFASLMLVGLEERMRQYLAVVNAAHTIGPFLDPTKYRDALQRDGNMDDLAALVRLALPLAVKARDLRERFVGTASTSRAGGGRP